MYTKEYFRQQLSDIISPIESITTAERYSMQDTVRGTKIFRRTLRLLHVRYGDLCRFGRGGGENETFEKLYITGITSGADKKNDGYWGDCHDKDQRFVEMAAFAYGLIFAPEKVWEPLKSTAKKTLKNGFIL